MRGFFLFILVVVILSSFVVASVIFNEEGIEKNYGGGDNISGWVNLSFSDVPASSLVESNFEGSIKVLDLLSTNNFSSIDDYTCSTPGCLEEYNNGITINNLDLTSDNNLIGIKFLQNSGTFDTFEDFNLKILGTSAGSCTNQLRADILDDGKNIISE